MSGLVYGIDFGTSTSAIMVGDLDGSVRTVPDPAAPLSVTMPTSVCLNRSGVPVVGAEAERIKLRNPGYYRHEFKRDFGDDEPIVLGTVEYLPHQLAALVLGFLRDQASKHVPGEPDKVVIGVPASWELGNRELMLEAARLAGFDLTRTSLVAEPAAAAAHVFTAYPPLGPRTLFMYDLGGGTFDCCVARDAPGGLEVVGPPGGIRDVGGAAFDRLILGRVRTEFPAESATVLDPADRDPAILRRRLELNDACEQLKIRLSDVPVSDEMLSMLGAAALFELTREEFEELIRPVLDETLRESDRLLAGLGLDWADIDTVVPIGGSTRIPGVGRLLYEHTRQRILRVDDPETAVVRGAVEMARAAGRAAPPRVPTEPAPQGCETWPRLAAVGHQTMPRPADPDDPTVTIAFANIGNQVLRVCWVGYDGIPQLYAYLHPGAAYLQPSYPEQVWLIYAPDESVRGAYRPGTASCLVETE